MKRLKQLFLQSWKRYVTAGAFCVVLALIVLILKGFRHRVNYVDALTISGAVTFLIGMLMLVWYYGAFDTFGFAFTNIFRDPGKRFKSLYDYCEIKTEKRRKGGYVFMPYITVGLAVLLIGLLIGIGL